MPFALTLVLALTGNRVTPTLGWRRFGIIVPALVVLVVATYIVSAVCYDSPGAVAPGLYLVVAAAIILIVAASIVGRIWMALLPLVFIAIVAYAGFVHVVYNAGGTVLCAKRYWSLQNTVVDLQQYYGTASDLAATGPRPRVVQALFRCALIHLDQQDRR